MTEKSYVPASFTMGHLHIEFISRSIKNIVFINQGR